MDIYLTIGCIALFVAFLMIGALCGFVRGYRKAGLRFIYFLFGVVVIAFFTNMISEGVMGIDISSLVGSDTPVSIKTYIQGLFMSNATVANLISEVPSLSVLAENLPVVVASAIIFIVLVYIVKFVTLIFYVITAKCVVSDTVLVEVIPDAPNLQLAEAQATHEKTVYVKKNKNGLGGAIVGALFALSLMVLTFFPLNTIVKTYVELSQASIETVSADDGLDNANKPNKDSSSAFQNSDGSFKKTNEIIDDLIPAEAKKYVDLYAESFFFKATGLFGLDKFIFDQVTKMNFEGETVMFRQEIISASKTYDELVYYFDLDFHDLESIDFKTLNFTPIENAIDNIFGSTLIKVLANEIVPFAMEKLKEMDKIKNLPDYDMIVRFIDSFEFSATDETETTEKVVETLEADFKAIIKVLKTLCNSGFIDEIKTEPYDMVAISEIASKSDFKFVSDLIDGFLESKSVRNVSVVGFDIGFEKLAGMIGMEKIADISKENIDFEVLKKDLLKFSKSLINLCKEIGSDFEIYCDDILKVLGKDGKFSFEKVLGEVGELFEIVRSNALYGNMEITPVDEILDRLSQHEQYGKYFDYTLLKNKEIVIKDEMVKLAPIFNGIRELGVVEIYENEAISDKAQAIVDGLLVKNNSNETLISRIISPVFGNKVISKTFDFLSDELISVVLNKFGVENVENIDFSKDFLAQKSTLVPAFEEILGVYSLIVEITSDESFEIENLTESQITKIENALTKVQANSYFDKNVEKPKGGLFKPVYVEIVNYLLKGKNVSIDIENIVWNGFISSIIDIADKLENVFEGEVSTETIIDFISENKDSVKQVFESLGFSESLVDSISNVSSNVLTIKSGQATKEEISNALNEIGSTLENLDEEALTNVLNLISEFSGQNLKNYLSTEIVSAEAEIAKTLANAVLYGVDADNIGALIESINSGNGYVSDAVFSADMTIDCGEMTESQFEDVLKNAGIEDLEEVSKYKVLFGFSA